MLQLCGAKGVHQRNHIDQKYWNTSDWGNVKRIRYELRLQSSRLTRRECGLKRQWDILGHGKELLEIKDTLLFWLIHEKVRILAV